MRYGSVHTPWIRVFGLIALLALTIAPASAERASESEMRRVCENFLTYMIHQQGDWAGSVNPSIADVQELRVRGVDTEGIGETAEADRAANGAPAADTPANGVLLARNYVITPRGHIVVPVLKDLPPIKVYSEECDLDTGQTEGVPALLRTILADRARRFTERYGSLDAIPPARGQVLIGRSHRALWERFLVNPSRFRADLAGGRFRQREEVGPLLTTAWHQFEPYNNACPMGDGGQCVVGCVATATAQVMRYWAWPPVGIGVTCYEWNGDQSCGGNTPGGELCADLTNPYDWANMPGTCYGGCTPQEEAALAEFNFEVGVTEQIDYGHCGSGGRMNMVNYALTAFFRYDPGLADEYRGQFEPDTWFALIQSEINAGRPMVYAYIGHALVCDGWRDTEQNEYHMNYGFGGGYNGWYAVDEMWGSEDPLDEMLIRGIMPDPTTVFTIRADGSGDLPTIQAAVDGARDGNTIELEDGVYTGDGNRDIKIGEKVITIRSVSGHPGACIIDCEGTPADPHRAFDLRNGETPATVIEGITIRGGEAGALDPSGGAVFCLGTSPTFGNCLFVENTAAERGGALYCGDGASPELRNCVFFANDALGAGGGLACDGAVPILENCSFVENAASLGSAVAAIGASPLAIESSILAFGGTGEPVACIAGGSATLICCDVYGNAAGDWVGCIAGQFGAEGNISEDPLFCDIAGLDFTLNSASPCVPHTPPNEECDLIGAFGVGCGAILVHEDGSGPFPTIQSAIHAAIEGSTIHLGDGTFTGEGNRDIDLMGKALTLRSESGDPESCVIDCQGTAGEWHRGFYIASGEGPQTILQDFTVRGGYYDIAGAAYVDASSPTFRNVTFADNYADFGGAVRCRNFSLALFDHVVFLRNSARIGGGAYCMGYSNATFRNCTFHANSVTYYGAGLRVHDHTNAILENTIIAFSPEGEALSCNNASYPVLTCCDLYGNAGGDWIEHIAEQYGVEGNISEDPLFCDPDNGNLRLEPGSPCGPFTPPNEECGLLGALPVGCGSGEIDEGGGDSEEGENGIESNPTLRYVWLRPARPSPMTQVTRIEFGVPTNVANAPALLRVIDPAGRVVRTLINERCAAGRYHATWDGRDDVGRDAPGGLYFLRFNVDTQEQIQRVVLVR